MMRTFVLTLATFALAGCNAQPEPESFTYDLTRSTKIDVEAHDSNGPIRGVIVSIRTPPVEPELTGDLLWMGATAADGHARAEIRTENAGDAVDITLHKAGWRGPWTDESLRESQGVTAPSSRQIIPLAQAQSISVDLERSK
jgi:hypothetical protein